MESIGEEIDAARFRCETALETHEYVNMENLSLKARNLISEQVHNAYMELKSKIDKKFFSFFYLTSLKVEENNARMKAKHAAEQMILTSTDEQMRNIAQYCLDTGKFLLFDMLSFSCTCPEFARYKAYKHCIWETMKFNNDCMHFRVDPTPLAGRRSAGRPRSVGNLYSKLYVSDLLCRNSAF